MILHVVLSSGRVLPEIEYNAILGDEGWLLDPSETVALRIGLPTFLSEATDKQKAWAQSIMLTCVYGFYEDYRDQVCPPHKLQAIFDVFEECILCQRDARWWIDNRFGLTSVKHGWKLVIEDVIGWASYLRRVMTAPLALEIPTIDRK